MSNYRSIHSAWLIGSLPQSLRRFDLNCYFAKLPLLLSTIAKTLLMPPTCKRYVWWRILNSTAWLFGSVPRQKPFQLGLTSTSFCSVRLLRLFPMLAPTLAEGQDTFFEVTFCERRRRCDISVIKVGDESINQDIFYKVTFCERRRWRDINVMKVGDESITQRSGLCNTLKPWPCYSINLTSVDNVIVSQSFITNPLNPANQDE